MTLVCSLEIKSSKSQLECLITLLKQQQLVSLIIKSFQCIVTEHPCCASFSMQPSLLTKSTLALAPFTTAQYHIEGSFHEGIPQPFVGIYCKLKKHREWHEMNCIMNASASALNAVLIIDLSEFPEYRHFHRLYENREPDRQCFQRLLSRLCVGVFEKKNSKAL